MHRLSLHFPYGALGLFLCGIILLALAGLFVQRSESRSFNEIESVESNRAAISTIFREQLDEETGVRGYAASWRKPLLQPYYEASKVLPRALARARAAMEGLGLRSASAALADAAKTNRQWQRHVAWPIIARHSNRPSRELVGKRLVDRFRADVRAVDHTLARRHSEIATQTLHAIRLGGVLAVAAVVILLLIGAVTLIRDYTLRSRLEDKSRQSDDHEKPSSTVASRLYRGTAYLRGPSASLYSVANAGRRRPSIQRDLYTRRRGSARGRGLV